MYFGRPPKDFSEYIRETINAGIWNPVKSN